MQSLLIQMFTSLKKTKKHSLHDIDHLAKDLAKLTSRINKHTQIDINGKERQHRFVCLVAG